MKLKVLKKFIDITDKKTVYEPGRVLTISNPGRVDNLINRGLCEKFCEEEAIEGKAGGEVEEKVEAKPAAAKPKKKEEKK